MIFLNDMGIDPYEWFDNPLDGMPIAKDEPLTEHTNRYAPPDKLAELEVEAISMIEADRNPRRWAAGRAAPACRRARRSGTGRRSWPGSSAQ